MILRRRQRDVLQGTKLCGDVKKREAEARRMHDTIGQSVTQALLLARSGDEKEAKVHIEESVQACKRVVGGFLQGAVTGSIRAPDPSHPSNPKAVPLAGQSRAPEDPRDWAEPTLPARPRARSRSRRG